MSESLIGKTVWQFDHNNRVYRKDENGRSCGAPIYRHYWRPIQVFGETKRSWLAGYEHNPYKIPKTGEHRGFALTAQEMEDDCWANEHLIPVLRLVESRMRSDLAFLKLLAEMVGYKPEAA